MLNEPADEDVQEDDEDAKKNEEAYAELIVFGRQKCVPDHERSSVGEKRCRY